MNASATGLSAMGIPEVMRTRELPSSWSVIASSPLAWTCFGVAALVADGAIRGSNSLIARLYRAAAGWLYRNHHQNDRRNLSLVDNRRRVRYFDLDVERLDPHVWENACTILGLTPKEGRDKDAIRKAHSHSISMLTLRSKAIDGPLGVEVGSLIQEVERAHRTLIDSLDPTTSQLPRDRSV